MLTLVESVKLNDIEFYMSLPEGRPETIGKIAVASFPQPGFTFTQKAVPAHAKANDSAGRPVRGGAVFG